LIDVRIASPEDLPALLALRHEVFVIGQDVPPDLEVDGLDPICTHFVAREGATIVGTARLRVTEDGHAKAERVAVSASHRGRGIGAAVMAALEAEAARLGHDEVVLNAQVGVIPFYEGLGYAAEGPVFDDAGIDHRKMRKALRTR
jgi:predicted GNAT family N-acyltransferase